MHPEIILKQAGDHGPRLLWLEPYLTASHRALVLGCLAHLPARWTALGLSGRHFRWRMRGAASFLALATPELLAQPWDGLLCSDMLALAELRGLVPSLARVPALLVMHENQLAFDAPGQADQDLRQKDLYLAFSNLASAQAAGRVVFNSTFHRDQFLSAAEALFARLPDMRPPGLVADIAAKSRVLPIPLDIADAPPPPLEAAAGPLRILWNHRWAPDKNPQEFFAALDELIARGHYYEVAVLGPRSGAWPRCFDLARETLGPRLIQWGPVDDRAAYWRWLHWADLVVSTAQQEYFGLSVAEAVWAGARPLVPRRLVYPSLYPPECLYGPGDLAARLAEQATRTREARSERWRWRTLASPWTWPAAGPAWWENIEQALETS